METLGSRIKQARKNKGLTQRQLADLIGAKHNSISNWEKDQNKPDPDTIELLCGVLDITPNWLLKSFDKKLLSDLVNDIRFGRTYEDFSGYTGVEAEYLRQIIEQEIDTPPTPEILQKITTKNLAETIDYIDLLEAAGHVDKKTAWDMRKEKIKKFDETYENIYKMNNGKMWIFNLDDFHKLPQAAKEELKNFIDYLKVKYKNDIK